MCGIAAYCGNKVAEPYLIDALKRMQYRGYDSFGITLIDDKSGLFYSSQFTESKIDNYKNCNLQFEMGIAHTRWATHGKTSIFNTHPIQCDELYIAHNGTVTNVLELSCNLGRAIKIHGDTDTEILGHWIDKHIRERGVQTLVSAIEQALSLVKGDYAIVFAHKKWPGLLFAGARGMPLFLGHGFVASDIEALAGYTKSAIRLRDNSMAIISREGMRVYNSNPKIVDLDYIQVPEPRIEDKTPGHHMLKEIEEQVDTMSKPGPHVLYKACPERIFLFGCGSSYHAALVGRYYFENISRIPCEVEYASQVIHRKIPDEGVFIALTQSGETKDTIEAMRLVQGRTLSVITNNEHSTAAKMVPADRLSLLNVGPEIGVAATKTFTAQLASLLVKAGRLYYGARVHIEELVGKLANDIATVLETKKDIRAIADEVANYSNCLVFGTGVNYPIALEAALKLKEVSYIHAEGMLASEVKHGPIALIDKNTVSVFLCMHHDKDAGSITNNMAQVKARGGRVFAICDKLSHAWAMKYADDYYLIPNCNHLTQPIVLAVATQLLAYYAAVKLGHNVDQPRNLAKSVTV